MKKEVKKSGSGNYNTVLKTSAICGILVFVVSILGSIMNQFFVGSSFLSVYSIAQSILINVLLIFFIYGFYVLGKIYNNKFLRVMSVLIIISVIIFYLTSLFLISPAANNLTNLMQQKASSLGLDMNTMGDTQAQAFAQALLDDTSFSTLMNSLISPLLLCVLMMIVLYILFGSALIKLRGKVEYAKVTGILSIVGASLMIILVGFVVMIVAYVFGIVLLFRESKKIVK